MDPIAVRADVPVLARLLRGRPFVYFDSACTSLRVAPVIDAMAAHARETGGCHGRAAHRFGRETSDAYAAAREDVRAFLGARRPSEIVFVRNTTEAINVVASGFPLKPGDTVLTTDLEHNSNFLPWRRLAATRGVRHATFRVDVARGFDMAAFRAALTDGVRLVAVPHVSNLCGISFPIEEITRAAHRRGAVVLVDGAQGVLTHPVDVAALDVDFYTFSLHKVFGPTGLGVLYGREERLATVEPLLLGGDTVDDVTATGHTLAPLPQRLEAGIACYEAAAGARAALAYLRRIGPSALRAHAVALNRRATEGLLLHPKVRLVGPADAEARGTILNFHVPGLDSRALARLLDEREGVMVRPGKQCVHAWFHANGVPDTVRASFSAYNTVDEVDHFLATMAKVLAPLA